MTKFKAVVKKYVAKTFNSLFRDHEKEKGEAE